MWQRIRDARLSIREGGGHGWRRPSGWLTLNPGGEPTPDKPEVELVTPEDSNRVSSFLNLWVDDLDRIYREWSDLGVEFLTEPKDFGHEKRAYFRDPDGHLVEVGERRFAE